MKLVTHEPIIKVFVNGFQITFPNKYTVLVKNGMNTKCTQVQKFDDMAEIVAATRIGGSRSPDVEVEIYDEFQTNITGKFGDSTSTSLGFVGPVELVNLLFIVSSLRNDPKRLSGTKPRGQTPTS